MSSKLDRLDEAWNFLEMHVSKGVHKKDVVPLLNEAGYRTQKGKMWTYQTLLLEQRRRGGTQLIKKSADNQKQDLIEKPRKIIKTKPKKLNEKIDVVDTHLEEILRSADFSVSVRQALDEAYTTNEVALALNRQGSLDSKGRPWTEASITHEWTQQVTRSLEKKNPFDRLEISEMVDATAPKAKKDLAWHEEKLQSKKSPVFEEVLAKIDLEMKKGTKYKTLVGILNMGGFLTRRGKLWTYPTLNREINQRKSQAMHKSDAVIASSEEDDSLRDLDALAYSRKFICEKILPKLMERGDKSPRGKTWTYEVLLWELLKAGLDLDGLVSEKPQKWWAKKKVKLDDGAPNIFDVLG